MHFIRRFLTVEKLIIFLFALTALIIPIEHKYDKPLRHFSRSLIPEGLSIPRSFDKKIYFYPSDLIAPVLLLFAIFYFRVPIRKLLFEGKGALLLAILCCALISVMSSPFSQYPLMYIRCLQLLTPFIFFAVLSTFSEELQKKIGQLVLCALIVAALFESAVAIAQYFNQGSIGLRSLGEPFFQPSVDIPHIKVPNGRRWLFDSLISREAPSTVVIRTRGTFCHPNILGGFLSFSLMATLYYGIKGLRSWALGLMIFIQSFALATTYSRSAIFALALSLISWFFFHHRVGPLWKTPRMRSLTAILIGSLLLCATLFSEQYTHRGGIVASTGFSKSSDEIRTYYQDIALRMIKDHPLKGVGYQLFSHYAPFYEKPHPLYETAVHNIYLLMASETGLFSLLLFLVWVGSIGISFITSKKDSVSITLFSIFLAILFIGLCDFYPLASHQGIMIFFIIGGLILRRREMAKPQSITQMFDQISPTYDRVNRILSLGMDRGWRRKTATFLPKKKNLHLLDLATGTADQIISLFESKASIGSAIGLDLASEMLSIGEKKIQEKPYGKQIELQVGDAMAIPFEPEQFDACTFSFGIRNVADPLISLSEIHRVLKPDGRCLVLEFSLPPFPIKTPYLFYLRRILPWLGGKLSTHPEAYRYLNRTIESFPSGKNFLFLMNRAGFSKSSAHPMAFGAVTLYVGEK